MTKQIDHEHTHEIVCPHCGYEQSDSWEYGSKGTVDCDECGKDYQFQRDELVTYTTWIKDKK